MANSYNVTNITIKKKDGDVDITSNFTTSYSPSTNTIYVYPKINIDEDIEVWYYIDYTTNGHSCPQKQMDGVIPKSEVDCSNTNASINADGHDAGTEQVWGVNNNNSVEFTLTTGNASCVPHMTGAVIESNRKTRGIQVECFSYEFDEENQKVTVSTQETATTTTKYLNIDYYINDDESNIKYASILLKKIGTSDCTGVNALQPNPLSWRSDETTAKTIYLETSEDSRCPATPTATTCTNNKFYATIIPNTNQVSVTPPTNNPNLEEGILTISYTVGGAERTPLTVNLSKNGSSVDCSTATANIQPSTYEWQSGDITPYTFTLTSTNASCPAVVNGVTFNPSSTVFVSGLTSSQNEFTVTPTADTDANARMTVNYSIDGRPLTIYNIQLVKHGSSTPTECDNMTVSISPRTGYWLSGDNTSVSSFTLTRTANCVPKVTTAITNPINSDIFDVTWDDNIVYVRTKNYREGDITSILTVKYKMNGTGSETTVFDTVTLTKQGSGSTPSGCDSATRIQDNVRFNLNGRVIGDGGPNVYQVPKTEVSNFSIKQSNGSNLPNWLSFTSFTDGNYAIIELKATAQTSVPSPVTVGLYYNGTYCSTVGSCSVSMEDTCSNKCGGDKVIVKVDGSTYSSPCIWNSNDTSSKNFVFSCPNGSGCSLRITNVTNPTHPEVFTQSYNANTNTVTITATGNTIFDVNDLISVRYGFDDSTDGSSKTINIGKKGTLDCDVTVDPSTGVWEADDTSAKIFTLSASSSCNPIITRLDLTPDEIFTTATTVDNTHFKVNVSNIIPTSDKLKSLTVYYALVSDGEEIKGPDVTLMKKGDEHDYSRVLTFYDCQVGGGDSNISFIRAAGTTGELYYQKDNETSTWIKYNDGDSISPTARGTIRLKGNLRNSNGNGIGTFKSSNQCSVSGNPMSLVVGGNTTKYNTLLDRGQFACLFGVEEYNSIEYGMRYMKSAKNIELSATALTPYCYDRMFCRCFTLNGAPKLPATTLAEGCYSRMFFENTALEAVENDMLSPEGLNSTLPQSCYYGMFAKCSNLKNIPSLKATTIGIRAYYGMFSGCTSLEGPNNISEEPLFDYNFAYGNELNLQNYACNYMFYNCTSLTATPHFKFGTISEYCCNVMFKGCTALTSAIIESDGTAASGPHGLYNMFGDCSGLTSVTLNIDTTDCGNGAFSSMFYNCTRLATVDTNLNLHDYARESCCNSMFYNCSRLTAINMSNDSLQATTLGERCYENMFYNCRNITNCPISVLPATISAEGCYRNMFYLCDKMTTAPKIEVIDFKAECCCRMFAYCSSLTDAPEFSDYCGGVEPSYTWGDRALMEMFLECHSLSSITWVRNIINARVDNRWCSGYTAQAGGVIREGITRDWVKGVSPTGTFTGSVSRLKTPQGCIDTSGEYTYIWLYGDDCAADSDGQYSGIPRGWTIFGDSSCYGCPSGQHYEDCECVPD